MTDFIFGLFLLSVLFFALGMIKPKWALSGSRKRVAVIFVPACVVLFILIGVTAPKDQKVEADTVAMQTDRDQEVTEQAVATSEKSSQPSLGVKRSEITELLKPIGFEFDKAPDNEGRENYVAEYGVTLVQIFGPEDDVSEIQFLIGATQNEASAKHQAGTIMAVLNTVIPEWHYSEIGTWIGQAVAENGGEYNQHGKQITFTVHDNIGMASIVVTADPSNN